MYDKEKMQNRTVLKNKTATTQLCEHWGELPIMYAFVFFEMMTDLGYYGANFSGQCVLSVSVIFNNNVVWIHVFAIKNGVVLLQVCVRVTFEIDTLGQYSKEK